MSLQGNMPLIFGEVLYDIFPDQSVLGGAPFNVCWHLAGFGLNPQFISRIGNDKLGEHVVQAMHDWGLSTQGLQHDDTHGTGRVSVSLQQGQPQYVIEENRAYDHIIAERHYPSYPQTPLLYHGTLALRSSTNRNTLNHILSSTQAPCFVDLNLRDPWWSPAQVTALLKRCCWAKMNDIELEIVSREAMHSGLPLNEQIKKLAEAFDIDHLFVTCGASGSYCAQQGEVFFQPSAPVANVVDTVGAGDAFSAVCIIGLLLNWPTPLILLRAGQFAAALCQQRGALLDDKQVYMTFLQQWNEKQ